MKRLWAPWRYDYVSADRDPAECFICRAAQAESSERKAHLVLDRTSRAIALLNRYPYNTGHLMVAPLRHAAQLEDVDPDELTDMWDLICRFKAKLVATSRPHGFNVGINLGQVAGAGLPEHIHVHLVPRWAGDTNFMSVLADAKVMPQSLGDVYAKLTDGQE